MKSPPFFTRIPTEEDLSALRADALVTLRTRIDGILSRRSDELSERMDTIKSILDGLEKGGK
jgi:hypothetical protein